MCFRYRYLPDPLLHALMGPPLDCWGTNEIDYRGNNGSDMLVMASAAKSGAVLSARIVVEVCYSQERFI